MTKLNEVSYCHDCGKKIEGENFYCDSCLSKNGLNNLNIVALIVSFIQPIAGIFMIIYYKETLNPGIYKGAKYGLISFAVCFLLTFVIGFIAGFLSAFL